MKEQSAAEEQPQLAFEDQVLWEFSAEPQSSVTKAMTVQS